MYNRDTAPQGRAQRAYLFKKIERLFQRPDLEHPVQRPPVSCLAAIAGEERMNTRADFPSKCSCVARGWRYCSGLLSPERTCYAITCMHACAHMPV